VTAARDEGSKVVGGRYRVTRYRGFRLVKAQTGWDVWRGTTQVGWEPTKPKAKAFVDECLTAPDSD
jgi:hypothetical protein